MQFTFVFDAMPVSALVRYRPPCAFQELGIGWLGGHHCPRCYEETERGCAAFAAAVARGEYDEQGYTPAERRAQQKRLRRIPQGREED